MTLTYQKAAIEDIDSIYTLCKSLIEKYEDPTQINLEKVLSWVRRKIEKQLDQYTVVFADGQKAGYYHLYRNDDNRMELDDLYVFPAFQNQGIGTEIIKKCLSEAQEPVILYVFVKNTGAVSLYQRLGFKVIETLGSTRFIMCAFQESIL